MTGIYDLPHEILKLAEAVCLDIATQEDTAAANQIFEGDARHFRKRAQDLRETAEWIRAAIAILDGGEEAVNA